MFIVVRDKMLNLQHYDKLYIQREDEQDGPVFNLVLRRARDTKSFEFIGGWASYERAYHWFCHIKEKMGASVFEVHF